MVYPLNQMIEDLITNEINEETGELCLTDEEIQEKIAALEITFDDKVKALRNSYMTDMWDAAIIKAEAQAMYDIYKEALKRAERAANRAERTKRYLAWLLQGDKFDKDGVKISYTTRQITVIEDEQEIKEWAKVYAPGMLKDPELRKEELNKALRAGNTIPFAHIEAKKYINIR